MIIHLVKGIAAIAIVCGAPAAVAMDNEPSDFFGIEWGAPIDKYRPELKALTEDEQSGHYRRLADRPYFAGVEVRRISYHFYKGDFVSGTILTVGSNDLNRILSHLKDRHGAATTSNPRHRVHAWEGERAGVTVSCDMAISCYTEFYDKALRLQEIAATSKDAKQDSD